MAERIVKCIKLGKELPGLNEPPIPSEIGKKVYENVSQQAWSDFLEHFKMIVNEYMLDLSNPASDDIFEQKIKEYFFEGDI